MAEPEGVALFSDRLHKGAVRSRTSSDVMDDPANWTSKSRSSSSSVCPPPVYNSVFSICPAPVSCPLTDWRERNPAVRRTTRLSGFNRHPMRWLVSSIRKAARSMVNG